MAVVHALRKSVAFWVLVGVVLVAFAVRGARSALGTSSLVITCWRTSSISASSMRMRRIADKMTGPRVRSNAATAAGRPSAHPHARYRSSARSEPASVGASSARAARSPRYAANAA